MDVYSHIPRTGGQCLSQLVLQNYSAVYFTGDTAEEMCRLRANPPDSPACMGHLPCGLMPGRHVAFLREPVARLRSEYAFHRQTPGAYHHAAITGGMAFADWLAEASRISPIMDNMQCRFVSGGYVWERPTLRTLARAKETLCHMPAFGVAEYFDESVLLVCRAFGLAHPFVMATNRKPLAAPAAPAPDDSISRLDDSLWRFAADLLFDSIDRFGAAFQEALAAYREVSRELGKQFAHACTQTLGYDQPPELIAILRARSVPREVRRFLSG